MKLYRRTNGFWYIRFGRGVERSTRTKDRAKAERVYRKVEREYLAGRLVQLDTGRRITVAEFKDLYAEFCRGGKAPETARKNRVVWNRLSKDLGPNTLLSRLTERKITLWRSILKEHGLTPATIDSYLRHVKAGLGWAVEQGYPTKRPRIRIRQAQQIPKFLRPGEIDRLLDKARPHPWQVFLTVVLWTGVRRSEALGLTWRDVDLEGDPPTIRVRGKGGKERLVPLLPAAADALRSIGADIGPVFPEWRPDTATHKMADLAREVGVKATIHTQRHTAATYMVAKGVDLRTVQQILGHSSLSTTLLYAHVLDQKHLYDAMLKLDFAGKPQADQNGEQ